MTTAPITPLEAKCRQAANPHPTPATAPTFADHAWAALTAATGLTAADVDMWEAGDTVLYVATGSTRLALIWPTPSVNWWFLKANRVCPECGAARFTQQIAASTTDPATIIARIGTWMLAHPEARCPRHATEVSV